MPPKHANPSLIFGADGAALHQDRLRGHHVPVHPSTLHTIELIGGLMPMAQLDAAAPPKLNAFTSEPNLRLYAAVRQHPVRPVLYNAGRPPADFSRGQNLTVEDHIDGHLFSLAIWRSIREGKRECPLSGTAEAPTGPAGLITRAGAALTVPASYVLPVFKPPGGSCLGCPWLAVPGGPQSFWTGTSLTGVIVLEHLVKPGHRNLCRAFTSSASTTRNSVCWAFAP
jgi:hypothetical protein